MSANEALVCELTEVASDLRHIPYDQRARLAEQALNLIRALAGEAEAGSLSFGETKPFVATANLAPLARSPGTLTDYETSGRLEEAARVIHDLEQLIGRAPFRSDLG